MPVDNSWDEFERSLIKPYDTRLTPTYRPIPDAFDYPTYKICVNAEWWAHINGAVERLAWRDAWSGTDEEKQAAVEQVIAILDAIGKRELCMPLVNLQTTCDCQVINYYNEINNYSHADIVNETIYDFFQTNITNVGLSDGTMEAQAEQVLEAAETTLPPSWKICQASTMLFYWLHDIGIAGRDGKIEFTSPVPLIDKISEWASAAFTFGSLLLKVFPASGALAATVGTAAQIAYIADDISHFAAAISSSDFSENEINDFVCALFEAMDSASAGFSTFQSVDYGNADMNTIWASIADAQLYGVFLALLDDPEITYKFHCCTDCIDTYAGWENVVSGERHYADKAIVMLPLAGTGGGTITRNIVIRVNLDAPAILRECRWYAEGYTYHNPYVPPVDITIRTDQHSEEQCISVTTGLSATRDDLRRGDYFRPPATMTNGSQPAINWFEIKAEFALCASCSSASLDSYAKAWGFITEIRYCLE